MNNVRNNVLRIWVILIIGLLNVQRCSAAIPDAIYLGNIMAEIMLVSDQANPIPGKYRVDGTWPETITIDYNDLNPVKIISMPDKIDLGDIDKEGLDRCLLAIVNEPNLMERIDQRYMYNSDDMYLDTLHRTLDSANKFIPYDLSKLAKLIDANESTNLTVSLCVHESKVYFWNSLTDRDVIGWISIQGIGGGTKNWNEPKLTVWIIPRLDKTTPFTRNWSEYARQENVTSKKALMKLALAVDIIDTNSIGEQLHGKVTDGRFHHNAKILMRGNILQAEIMLRTYEIEGWLPRKDPVSENIFKNYPTAFTFTWPPKMEDNENETSN